MQQAEQEKVWVYEVTARRYRSRTEPAVAVFLDRREAVRELHRQESEADDGLRRRIRSAHRTWEEVGQVLAKQYGGCHNCGSLRARAPISNGPNEPLIGVLCEKCQGESDDPQALAGADHYHIDWNEPIGL